MPHSKSNLKQSFLFKDDEHKTHPLVQFLREIKLNVTWKELAQIMMSRRQKKGHFVHITSTTIINFSNNRSYTHWFWPEIGEMVLQFWNEERNQTSSIENVREIDLFYSDLFSCDLKQYYAFLYYMKAAKKEVLELDENLIYALHCSEAVMNAMVNDIEDFFQFKLPTVSVY